MGRGVVPSGKAVWTRIRTRGLVGYRVRHLLPTAYRTRPVVTSRPVAPGEPLTASRRTYYICGGIGWRGVERACAALGMGPEATESDAVKRHVTYHVAQGMGSRGHRARRDGPAPLSAQLAASR